MNIWGEVFIFTLITCAAGGRVLDEDYQENWGTYEWKIILDRAVNDKFLVMATWPTSAKKPIEIKGATCNYTSNYTMQCTCLQSISSFSPESKECLPNEEVKEGCTFTTGSYRWDTGWLWDKMDSVLMVLDTTDETYGGAITMGFNASTNIFKKCFLNSINEWTRNGSWNQIDVTSVTSIKPVFYKLKNFWHVFWDTQTMSDEGKNIIKGKILRFIITCQSVSLYEEGDEQELASCLTFKVSGTLEIHFTPSWTSTAATTLATQELEVTTAPKVLARAHKAKDKTVIIVLTVLGVVVLLTFVIVLYCCFRKKKACFTKRGPISDKGTGATREPMLNGEGETESHV